MGPEALLSLAGVVLVLLGIGAAVSIGAYVLIRLRAGEGLGISLRFMFRAYLYIVTVAGLLVLVSGFSSLVKAGLSLPLGREFSYVSSYYPQLKRIPPPAVEWGEEGEPGQAQYMEPTAEEQEAQQLGLDRAFDEGLLRGVSWTVVGAIIWGVHLWGRRKLETEQEPEEEAMNRVYLIVLLIIFSIITIVSLPQAMYDTLRFYFLEPLDELRRASPGGVLATSLVALPIWLAYGYSTLRLVRRRR